MHIKEATRYVGKTQRSCKLKRTAHTGNTVKFFDFVTCVEILDRLSSSGQSSWLHNGDVLCFL
jgi:hypothetical protein